MVNEAIRADGPQATRNERTRTLILESLKTAAGPLSGVALGDILGVSRVAIWKAIKSLIESGYRIESARGGYRLVESPKDALYPWEFSDYAGTIRHWDETDSTMNRAREAALSGAKGGTVMIAERQSAGRGTNSKMWESPEGGLFFTIIRRPTLPVGEVHQEVLRMQCAVSESLASRASVNAGVLWPNDVAVRSNGGGGWNKAAGILAEYLVTGTSIEYLALGVGVNTGKRPSVRESTSVNVSRSDLLRDVLASPSEGIDALIQRWNALCPLVGKPIEYSFAPYGAPPSREGARAGVFLGTDEQGSARIATAEGGERRYPPGIISLCNKGRNA